MAELNTQPNWDPSQFKLQLDGTFRISIRGMAAMAGVDDGGLARSLKTAADENPLPCARSLVAQGFYPADVSTWGETGGIPEDAAPFILEHYGITATSPSALARQVLLSFSRVGINAYLKERLGVSQVRDTQPLALAPAPNEDLAFAGLVATMVEKVGGSAKNSLAISFTALANKHPDYRQLFLENQRLLCPSVEEFVNQTKILEGLESQVTEPVVDHLTALAKEAGFINKKDKRQLVNALLCEAGLQFRTSDKRRGQAPYALTKQGARYAREETRPAMYQDDGAWVPQLLWNFQETLAFLISWINSNLQPVSSRG